MLASRIRDEVSVHWQSSVEEFKKLRAEIFPEDGSEPSEPEPEELLICSQCQNQFNPDYCDFDQDGDGEHPLCQNCWDNNYCWCARCYVVFDFSQSGFWCHSCDFKFCVGCLGAEIQTDFHCHGCYDSVEYFYCEGCGYNFYDHSTTSVRIEAAEYCQHCLDADPDEMAYIQCSICEENIFDSSKKICWLCGRIHCDKCKNETFPELCVSCDREASSDEDETIEITSQYKVTEQASDDCWICQKKIWRLKNDPRRISAFDLYTRVAAHYNVIRWQTTQAQRNQYCAMNNIVGDPTCPSRFFDMNVDVELPFPEVDNTGKTMINACKCGPCHVVCLYKLRRADPDKFFNSRWDIKQNNKKLLYRQCINCGTKWKNELYMMFCDNEEFNSDMDEQDKHNARADLAQVMADNIAAAHQWSEFTRQDERLKGSYALTNIPEDVVKHKLNDFLMMPEPQPTAARLLKDDRRVVNVKKVFGRDASPSIYRAADFLAKFKPFPVRLMLEQMNSQHRDEYIIRLLEEMEEFDAKFDESLPMAVLFTQKKYRLWSLMKEYDLPGFLNSFNSGWWQKEITYEDLVRSLAKFEKGNQGESKSST